MRKNFSGLKNSKGRFVCGKKGKPLGVGWYFSLGVVERDEFGDEVDSFGFLLL